MVVLGGRADVLSMGSLPFWSIDFRRHRRDRLVGIAFCHSSCNHDTLAVYSCEFRMLARQHHFSSEVPTVLDDLSGNDRLIVALDVPSIDDAITVVERLDNVSFFKIGLRLYSAGALSGKLAVLVDRLRPQGQIFFDLKYPGDIDTTIASVVADYKATPHVKFLTLNEFMPVGAIRAARAARGDSPTPKLLMVPYLSSLDGTTDLKELYGESDFETFLLKRAHIAIESGCDGLIASGEAIALFRRAWPKESGVVIVSPGIRPASVATDDHKRHTTPRAAIELGADYLVVGRPILKAPNPRDAAQKIIDEIDAALARRKPSAGQGGTATAPAQDTPTDLVARANSG